MQPDLRFSDAETDEALRLPSRKAIVALTALSLFCCCWRRCRMGRAPRRRSQALLPVTSGRSIS
jgi:hypothetical protein